MISNKLKETFETLSNEEFEKYRDSLRTSILEKDSNLTEEGFRFWTEIERHQYIFDRSNEIKCYYLNFSDLIKCNIPVIIIIIK